MSLAFLCLILYLLYFLYTAKWLDYWCLLNVLSFLILELRVGEPPLFAHLLFFATTFNWLDIHYLGSYRLSRWNLIHICHTLFSLLESIQDVNRWKAYTPVNKIQVDVIVFFIALVGESIALRAISCKII